MSIDLDKHTTIGSIANLVYRALAKYQVDPCAIITAAGIDPKLIGEPDSRFTVRQMQKLWHLSTKATNDPCFGLRVGQLFQPAALHGLGFSWLASESSRDAMNRLIKYSSLLNTIAEFSLEDQGDKTVLQLSGAQRVNDIEPAVIDFSVVAIIKMCRITSTGELKPMSVELSRKPHIETCQTEVEKFLQCKLTYGSESTRIVFDRGILDKPLASPNYKLARLNDQVVEHYLSRFQTGSISRQVRTEIINRLPDGNATEEFVAKQLNMSKRTLQRKLAEEQGSFRRILNDVRRELAYDYMKQPHRTVTEITYLLGFSEPANFTRAFKRWSGCSPVAYRNQMAN